MARSKIWALFLVLVISALVLPATAWAQQDPMDTVREANRHYDAGEFHHALRLYREAHDALGDARLLYRIGLSYEHIGNYRRARQFLQRYLAEDRDSPVRGRVEANIETLLRLEDQIQSFLFVETEPAGAQIFLHGYLGEAEGVAPEKVPVGAGESRLVLIFPEGQRLEVSVQVGAGQTEERFFSVGTAARPAQAEREQSRPEELASLEPIGSEEPQKIPEISEEEWIGEDIEVGAEGEAQEERSHAQRDDAIPMPGSEPEQRRTIQLDYVDMGPPTVAVVFSGIGIVSGNLLMAVSLLAPVIPDWNAESPYWGGFLFGAALVAGGSYLLGRNWRRRLPRVQAGAAFEPSLPAAFSRSESVTQLQLRFEF